MSKRCKEDSVWVADAGVYVTSCLASTVPEGECRAAQAVSTGGALISAVIRSSA